MGVSTACVVYFCRGLVAPMLGIVRCNLPLSASGVMCVHASQLDKPKFSFISVRLLGSAQNSRIASSVGIAPAVVAATNLWCLLNPWFGNVIFNLPHSTSGVVYLSAIHW
jgi:hypothetical protein